MKVAVDHSDKPASGGATGGHKNRSEAVEVFGYRLFDRDCDEIPIEGPPRVVQTMSPNSYGIASRDAEFRAALQGADFLVLDGVYFGLASILLRRRRVRINNGPTVFAELMRRLDDVGGRAFFLGSSEETLGKMSAQASQKYPAVTVGTHSPPYRQVFSEEENDGMIAAINAFRPDVVFVGMTAPKQEKWAFRHRDRMHTGLVVSVGAVFDWFAGNEMEIAPIWWKLHLGWLVRTIRRPEILKRYPNVGIFFWHLSLAVLGLRKSD